MSGVSYDKECPNCGGTLDCYSDYKPFDHGSGQCLDCGFYYFTKTGQLTLEELNNEREERNEDWDLEDNERYEKLTILPKIDPDLLGCY